jgi:2-polyprenyl-3-methyl-5-hydroxy-6-metoxy-1,4-benzoquinol methylase
MVNKHYDRHLGPVYTWMLGGAESAIERGAGELTSLGIVRAAGGLAVDLGAGFGMHAIPLARMGFKVLAVDACAVLLEELESLKAGLDIETVQDDLCALSGRVCEQPELVLCMGDTITHLPDEQAVVDLVENVSAMLVPGGCFVMTLRDYSSALTAERRFIPVRSDDRRILTCFLE